MFIARMVRNMVANIDKNKNKIEIHQNKNMHKAEREGQQ